MPVKNIFMIIFNRVRGRQTVAEAIIQAVNVMRITGAEFALVHRQNGISRQKTAGWP